LKISKLVECLLEWFWDYFVGSIAPGMLNQAQLKHLKEKNYYLNQDLSDFRERWRAHAELQT
jgi:hypothetical protein